MKIFIDTLESNYSLYGQRYFSEKSGIKPDELKRWFTANKFIDDKDGGCKNKIEGHIIYRSKKIPVFSYPAEILSDGDYRLMYSGQNRQYPCIVFGEDRIDVGLDLFEHIGFCLSGNLERFRENNEDEINNLIRLPFVDYYCKILSDIFLYAHQKSNLPLIKKSLWKNGQKYAVCLTHDVDEVKKSYQWITHPLKLVKKKDFNGFLNQFYSFVQKIKGYEPYWTFEKVMEMEGNLNVKSSFYFLNESGRIKYLDKTTWRHAGRNYDWNDPKIKELIREIHSKGWEVGLHGSFYSYNNPELLKNEKDSLENVLGNRIFGGRQHNLNLTIPNTWIFHENAGLLYDTTLGSNKYLGFRWGSCFPFRPFYEDENRELDLLEIPTVIEDLPYFRFQDPWSEFLKIEKEVEEVGGVLTLLWHHSVLNDYEFPGWADEYKRVVRYCNDKESWVTSAKEIYEWWKWRELTSFDYEYDGDTIRIFPFPENEVHYFDIYFPDDVSLKNIINAKILKSKNNMVSIQTDKLYHGEFIELEVLGG
ncbi:hypothetical protein F1737_06270 [Methanoplanus sp. FWC-SCC4]|uniref:Uncharacterized protein n=1 Tax=Methanochimaera problematica TaxID=2609417 RepID=A0AA97I362_9EURY|nr:polysaccharide deacetylase family protein [Methanoplanus sp. FWC-SCC4]WOF16348.1 hypothetical protein F1737_06270 [Methanoplanus sp. FWC-SCC4]